MEIKEVSVVFQKEIYIIGFFIFEKVRREIERDFLGGLY